MTLSPTDLAAIRKHVESTHLMEIGAHQTGQTTIATTLTDRRKLLEHIDHLNTRIEGLALAGALPDPPKETP